MPRRRGKQQRRTRRQPPSPGPAICSPFASARRNGQGRSCLPSPVRQRITSTLRVKHGGAKETSCQANDERCLVEQSQLPYREKKELLQTYFRPAQPAGWKEDPDMWLNSDDIQTVMKQYEKAYPNFRFLGVVPIDFSAPDPYKQGPKQCMYNQFCEVNLEEERQKGRTILGAVFNLDPHNKSGSHWIALAIDLVKHRVYYFDSYGIAPPPQIARFMRYLTLQDPKLRLESNGRRFQFSQTECGMYSLYFIIRMIAGESFHKFCRNPIDDKWMLEFRKVLFDPNASSSSESSA